MTNKTGKPGWNTWLHVQTPSLWEGVVLSLDIESTDHDYDAKCSVEWNTRTWDDVAKRLMVATRTVRPGGRLKDSLYPATANTSVSLADFAVWAKSVNWDMPTQLANPVATVPQPAKSGRWPWGD